MNDSPPINLTLTQDMLRGSKRNQVPYLNRANPEGDCARDQPVSLSNFMTTIATRNPVPLRGGSSLEAQYNSCNVGIQVDPRRLANAPWLMAEGESPTQRIPVSVNNSRLLKDEIAILDIINSNLYDRPIYWAVTCQRSKLLGLDNYVDLEGLGLKLTVTPSNSGDRNLGLIGSGGIDAEKTADLVLNKWKWGNFDKFDTHISSSYQPAIQSMQLVILRTMNELMMKGDTEKALQVGDRYFQSFPDMNFPFFYQTLLMLQPYFQAQQLERVSQVMEQLAINTADRLDFYDSISPEQRSLSYAGEIARGEAIVKSLLAQVRRSDNEALKGSIEQILANHAYLLAPAAPQNPG
jgi:hypothetical protein